ncbi:hypothetical protein [Fibrobacter sp. UWB12]|uniref:hypothetical protein n=1 Tax=Fibrobacter sp. UWB12 TaxID=1896203 RepID=UPI000935111E|nr:hypothetical protein [Fibrobacter sp. UWB12]
MAMINLFKKISSVGITTTAFFCALACSDKIAGTAEEPNQVAYGTSSSSEFINENPDVRVNSSSSNIEYSSGIITSSDTTPVPNPSTSSSVDPIGNPGNFGHSEGCYTSDGQKRQCGDTETSSRSLNDYLNMYGITRVAFDTNVLAYNKTFVSTQDTADNATVAELRTLGLHKITKENQIGLVYLFKKTTTFMGGKFYEKDGTISFQMEGCQLYILNIEETSPAVHVLSSITKDTITIADFHDKCDYERLPYYLHVGFLFEYCGEFSESPEINRTSTYKETIKCGSVEYDEFINKKKR